MLIVVGNRPGFLGTMNEVAQVEKDMYSVSLKIMPMCLWSPPPYVVGTVASIAPSSWVSWFMSLLVGYPSILVMSNFLRLSSVSCLMPMVEVKLAFC